MTSGESSLVLLQQHSEGEERDAEVVTWLLEARGIQETGVLAVSRPDGVLQTTLIPPEGSDPSDLNTLDWGPPLRGPATSAPPYWDQISGM